MSANVLLATCPITEECPIPKLQSKLISTLVIVDHFSKKKKEQYDKFNGLLATKLKTDWVPMSL